MTIAQNRLASETSPYLLQHASNPVDWYPWGSEALNRAQEENKPIFLSIGYSTCHWCHVMERESFEDEEVARILNRDFIPVKVDREQRPDLDAVYMAACQAFTGRGGWPLTVFLTPDGTPFFAASYLPKIGRPGQVGLIELLTETARMWQEEPERLRGAARQVQSTLMNRSSGKFDGSRAGAVIPDAAVNMLKRAFDPKYGGFGGAPKFPTPHDLLLLMDHYTRTNDAESLSMAERTLTHMYRGGLFDHIGGGFSRYSTDRKWFAPHFEKMLYDNALLLMAYSEAYHITGDEFYRGVARRTADYVFAELMDESGCFCCAQDADSEGEEGKYYLFTPSEVIAVLGQEEGAAFNRRFHITEKGNFEGRNIPNLIEQEDYRAHTARTQSQCRKLYEYRKKRMPLHRDNKVLVSWNALMIAALCYASRRLKENSYLDAAHKAMLALENTLLEQDRPYSCYREGQVSGQMLLDDWAYLAYAYLQLYHATLNAPWLLRAESAAGRILADFRDPAGGLYMTPSDGEKLFLRPKEYFDGAMPSGNSVAAYVFAQLAELTAERKWFSACETQLDAMAPAARENPLGHCFYALVIQQAMEPSRDLIALLPEQSDKAELLEILSRSLPDIPTLAATGTEKEALCGIAPFLANYPPPGSQPIFYLCENGSCTAPLTGFAALRGMVN